MGRGILASERRTLHLDLHTALYHVAQVLFLNSRLRWTCDIYHVSCVSSDLSQHAFVANSNTAL